MATQEALGNGTLTTLSPEEVKQFLVEGRIVLIDVRTPSEFAFERIEGALLAPLSSFQPETMPSQDSKGIVFHCGSGLRSKKVAEKYLAAGFEGIAHMDGGLAKWKQAGLSYITIDFGSGIEKVTAMKPVS